MVERMEDQIKILTQAYREELAQTMVGPAPDQEAASNDLLRVSECVRGHEMDGARCMIYSTDADILASGLYFGF